MKPSKIIEKLKNQITTNAELLLDDNEIEKYQNEINMNQNNIKDCIICYENILHIPFNCSHEICINCYCLVDRCYYKCC